MKLGDNPNPNAFWEFTNIYTTKPDCGPVRRENPVKCDRLSQEKHFEGSCYQL